MAICLNTKSAYKDFNMLVHDRYFVDKSGIIEAVSTRINTKNRYVCITRPRRFGKTSVLNMLGAYYCRAHDSGALFDGLDISRTSAYTQHLNKYNVINLCLNNLSDKGNTYEDYIFSHELYPEHYNDFLEFLRNLLKDKSYVALAYMTGVLPVGKYSTGSALNMFDEYTMLNDHSFDGYFGFTENEVAVLCRKQDKISIGAIRDWYNGYLTPAGTRIYNPRSVALALLNGYCQSYWTKTGKMDEVLFFLKYNIRDVRDDIVKMVNNTPVMIRIAEEYRAGQGQPANRREIYAAMIIYGLLSYSNGSLRIPNKELMLEFENALGDDDFGYVAELVRNSDEILDATWARKGDIVASCLHNIHNSELPVLKYNDENSLACVVTLAYLSARDKYRIEREEKSGKGFVDFLFHPRQKNLPGIILELKADKTPADAIAQILEKEYSEKLKKEGISSILAVGLNYDTARKEHQCVIEELN